MITIMYTFKMPRRKYYRKGGRKKNYRRGKNQIKKVVYALSENKYFDRCLVSQSIASTGTVYTLFDPAQGTTVTQRVGNSCRLDNITIRFETLLNDSTNILRFVIVRDFRCQGTAPVTNDIMEDSTTPLISPLKLSRRFSFIWDKYVMLNPGSGVSKIVSVYKKLNFKVGFNSSTTSDFGYNAIWLLALSDSSAPGHPVVNFTTRIQFKDM